MATYLIRCAEIGREMQAQRGKLRRDLAAVIEARVAGATIALAPGRLVVDAEPGIAEALAALPGVASVSPCERIAYAELEHAVVALARLRVRPDASFAMRVHRRGEPRAGDASEPSPAIARRLGDAVARATGARIDLTQPDVTLGVELRGDEAFVFDRVIAGIDHTGPTVPRAAGEPRFVADQMLGRLAARLRLLGYDTLTVHDLADSEVTRLAAGGGRILLTRDGALARTRAVPVHFVAATAPRAQLAEVLAAFALVPDPTRLFTRCTLCNALVEPVDEAAVGERLPPGVRARGLAFFRCTGCAHLYWRGSHVDRILAELAAAGVAVS
jgi:uncharacterized protein with PIN domain/tRNA(Ser,Leu) C12 N-acetylase TAN1